MYKNDLRYIIKGTTNHLAPPKSFDPDASLETVDLNEDDSGLEKFLSEDLLDDASPLPKDDEEGNLPSLNKFRNKEKSRETSHNESLQTLEEKETFTGYITNARTDWSSDDEQETKEHLDSDRVLSTLEIGEAEIETVAVSRSESLYYTPDDTLETLSELTIN